jgi:hypothetical protein
MEIKNPEFDDIRPYYDDEVPDVINRLVEDPEFKRVVEFIFSDELWKEFKLRMQTFKSKYDFQNLFVNREVYKLVEKMSDSIECTGFENIDKGKAFTYISNHRDIVLDASLLCVLLGFRGYDTTEIAI